MVTVSVIEQMSDVEIDKKVAEIGSVNLETFFRRIANLMSTQN